MNARFWWSAFGSTPRRSNGGKQAWSRWVATYNQQPSWRVICSHNVQLVVSEKWRFELWRQPVWPNPTFPGTRRDCILPTEQLAQIALNIRLSLYKPRVSRRISGSLRTICMPVFRFQKLSSKLLCTGDSPEKFNTATKSSVSQAWNEHSYFVIDCVRFRQKENTDVEKSVWAALNTGLRTHAHLQKHHSVCKCWKSHLASLSIQKF